MKPCLSGFLKKLIISIYVRKKRLIKIKIVGMAEKIRKNGKGRLDRKKGL